MKFETVSFMKSHAANLPLDEPLTITQNGKPVCVIQSYDEWEQQQEAIALLKLCNMAKNDSIAGRVTNKYISKLNRGNNNEAK